MPIITVNPDNDPSTPLVTIVTTEDEGVVVPLQLRSNNTHVQWRYKDVAEWTDLFALNDIKGLQGAPGSQGAAGANGLNVELRKSANVIQWRLTGDAIWSDLYNLNDFKGADGAAGTNGKNIEIQKGTTHIQWRLVGDTTWIDLVSLASLKGDTGATGPQGTTGTTGAAGTNGKNIEIQKGTTHIQWRLVGDTTWIDLVSLASLKGDTGATGDTGPVGPAGPQGMVGQTGPQGQRGSQWYGGTGAPLGTAYLIQDWYVDSANGNYYEKTGGSTWTLRGNLTGPQGPSGSGGGLPQYTLAQVRAFNGTNVTANPLVYITDYSGGIWYLDSADTSTSDNTGMVVVTSSSARYKRLNPDNVILVDWFGGITTNPTTNNTTIQAAIAYCISNKCDLKFASKTYKVNQLSFSNHTQDRVFSVNFNGAVIEGMTTSTPLKIEGSYWNIQKPTVKNTGNATYGMEIGWIWRSRITDLNTGGAAVYFTPKATDFGCYWNTFENWNIGRLTMDAALYSINSNIWMGGQMAGITITAPVLDFYSNIFSSIDFVGSINYHNHVHPLILRDCSLEGDFAVIGHIVREGGKITNVGNSKYFDGNPRSMVRDYNKQEVFGHGYMPENSTNLFAAGDASYISPNLSTAGVTMSAVTIATDAADKTGNSKVYRFQASASDDFPRLKFSLTSSMLGIAKEVGQVSFSMFAKPVTGLAQVAINTGSTDQYVGNFNNTAGAWNFWEFTVQVPSDATKVELSFIFVGAAAATAKDFYFDAVQCNLGGVAYAFSKSPFDTMFSSDITLDGGSAIQNMRFPNLSAAPSSPYLAQTYYNTSVNLAYYWNGTSWLPMNSSNVSVSGLVTTTNISSLRAINSATNGQIIATTGYYSANDGGHGMYVWNNTSTLTDDGGAIIQATGVSTGRFILLVSQGVSVRQFGAKGDDSTNDTSAIQKALNFAASAQYKRVYGKEGDIYRLVSPGNKNFMTSSVTGLAYCIDIPPFVTFDLQGATLKTTSDAVIVSNRNSHTTGDSYITLQNGVLDGGSTLITSKPFVFFYGMSNLKLYNLRVKNTTHLVSTITNVSNSYFDELIAENVVGNAWQFGLPTSGQDVRDSVFGKIYAYNITPESEPIVPGNPFIGNLIRCSIEQIFARNCGSGVKIQAGSKDVQIDVVDLHTTNNVNYNSGLKIQGDTTTKVQNVNVGLVRASSQRGCGLFIEYAQNVFVSKYIGENNAIDASYPDVWVAGDRVEIQSIFSNLTGGIGVQIRSDAKDYNINTISIVNCGVASNSAAVQVAGGSRGVINALFVNDDRATKKTTLGINISASDAVGLLNNLFVTGLGTSSWLGNISTGFFINNLRLTTAQRNDMIIPTAGTEYFDTTTNRKVYYNGSSWTTL